MTLQVAIIADDLTGALDTGTPFVEAGLKVAVAIEAEALEEALSREPDVVVVNTASRALPVGEAAERIATAFAAFGSARPPILIKKIDSRLKGNVAVESIALASAAGRDNIIVAPAIPDQQRFTVDGAVTGRGVETPLPIRPIFPSSSFSIDVCDAFSDSELDDLVRRTDWTMAIAVGARGLGSAFARSLTKSASVPSVFSPSAKTLFAFGSRDPITTAQIEQLYDKCQIASIADAPAGSLPPGIITRLPAVARCCGNQTADPEAVAAAFAEGIRETVERMRPDVIMMGGGDTALAILKEIGATVLMPNGEIEAGIPWFQIEDARGRTIRCAVKSGGFGNINSLLKLVPEKSAKSKDVRQDKDRKTGVVKKMAQDAPSIGEPGQTAKPERGKSVRLVDRVFDQLRERIRSGNYPPDSRLPGEHELASIMGVSRPIVRDALGRLREEGMVYSRQGAGTFVSAQASPATHLAYSPVKTIADIQRCYEFRLTIEPAAAFFAAQRRDEAAIQKIAAALADLREATSHQLHRTDADFVFHRCVTEAANNHYYTASIEALKPHIAVGMHLHGLSLMGPRLGLEKVFEEHNAIYQAIADGRAEDAERAMRLHLEGSRNRLFEDRVLDLSF